MDSYESSERVNDVSSNATRQSKKNMIFTWYHMTQLYRSHDITWHGLTSMFVEVIRCSTEGISNVPNHILWHTSGGNVTCIHWSTISLEHSWERDDRWFMARINWAKERNVLIVTLPRWVQPVSGRGHKFGRFVFNNLTNLKSISTNLIILLYLVLWIKWEL